jgi:hypothetical protein
VGLSAGPTSTWTPSRCGTGPGRAFNQLTVNNWQRLLAGGHFVPAVGKLRLPPPRPGSSACPRPSNRMASLSTAARRGRGAGWALLVAESSAVGLELGGTNTGATASTGGPGDTVTVDDGAQLAVTLSASRVPGTLAQLIGASARCSPRRSRRNDGTVQLPARTSTGRRGFARAEVRRGVGDRGPLDVPAVAADGGADEPDLHRLARTVPSPTTGSRPRSRPCRRRATPCTRTGPRPGRRSPRPSGSVSATQVMSDVALGGVGDLHALGDPALPGRDARLGQGSHGGLQPVCRARSRGPCRGGLCTRRRSGTTSSAWFGSTMVKRGRTEPKYGARQAKARENTRRPAGSRPASFQRRRTSGTAVIMPGSGGRRWYSPIVVSDLDAPRDRRAGCGGWPPPWRRYAAGADQVRRRGERSEADPVRGPWVRRTTRRSTAATWSRRSWRAGRPRRTQRRDALPRAPRPERRARGQRVPVGPHRRDRRGPCGGPGRWEQPRVAIQQRCRESAGDRVRRTPDHAGRDGAWRCRPRKSYTSQLAALAGPGRHAGGRSGSVAAPRPGAGRGDAAGGAPRKQWRGAVDLLGRGRTTCWSRGRGLAFGTALEVGLKLEETCLKPVRGLSYAGPAARPDRRGRPGTHRGRSSRPQDGPMLAPVIELAGGPGRAGCAGAGGGRETLRSPRRRRTTCRVRTFPNPSPRSD